MADNVKNKISQDILDDIVQEFYDNGFIITSKQDKKKNIQYNIKIKDGNDLDQLKTDLAEELEELPDIIKNVNESKKVSDIWNLIVSNLNTDVKIDKSLNFIKKKSNKFNYDRDDFRKNGISRKRREYIKKIYGFWREVRFS